MSNMSYCRWENTARDMGDCVDHQYEFQNDDPQDRPSEHELYGYRSALRYAVQMLEQANPEELEEAGVTKEQLDHISGGL